MITEDEVMDLLERADPVRHIHPAPAVDAAGYLDALRTRSSTVDYTDTEPTPTEPVTNRHRWLSAAAAAVTVAIVAGGLVLATRADDETGGATGGATAPGPVTEGPVTTPPPPPADQLAAVEVARGFLDAENAYDADWALTYLSDDYIVAEPGTPEAYRRALSWSQAKGDWRVSIDCEPQGESAGGIVIRCTYHYHTLGSEQIGLGPYSGGYTDFTIRDGQIVAADEHPADETNGSSAQMWGPFAGWIATEHPDDVAVMYQDAGQTGPLLTEESIRLWARRMPEYVADINRVAFVGLPPQGATPSLPERGELVVEFWGFSGLGTAGLQSHIVVYADGRLIWERQGALPEGANGSETGWLEQRLTPEGVELIRSEILSTGLFDRNLDFELNAPCLSHIAVRYGERLVRLNFGACGGEPATQDQTDAVLGLVARLYDLASWLPASAWEDRTIRGYVPSRFKVCLPDDNDAPFLAVRSLLPAHAVEALDTDEGCTDLTTAEARAFASALDAAGHQQTNSSPWLGDTNPFFLEYSIEADGQAHNLYFQPYLPHGDPGFLGSG